MSVRVTGSAKRLTLRLPAEGQTWIRQGDEMIPADVGGGGSGLSAEALLIESTDGPVLVQATGGNLEITAFDRAMILTATNASDGGIVLDTTGTRSPNPQEISIDAAATTTIRGVNGVFLQPANPLGLIGEYSGAGAAQLAFQAAVTDEASVVAAWNLYRTYLLTRGTMALS